MEKTEEMKIEECEESKGDNAENGYVVRIRGLPWSASKEDIITFFEGCCIKDGGQGIHLTMSKEGRPSGEAYVEFDQDNDYNKALSKDNEHLGSRYIEVFQATRDEMDWALRRCGLDGDEAFGDACVRLRGLPFGCSKEEIAQFFTGLEIVRNGITLPTDFQGRSTGEAYVQFASQEIAEKAMGKHKEKIGHRYIEIFKSSLQEIRSAMGMGPMRMRNMGANRLSPYDRMDRPSAYGGSYGMSRGRGRRGGPMGGGGGPGYGDRFGGYYGGRGGREDFGTGHRVHMRGLPYRAAERDIYEFFAPLNPVCVNVKYEPSGRSSGEADVEFSSHEEAMKAMKRDKEKIQHRYIELFLHSTPEAFRRSGSDSGGYDNYAQDDRSFGGDRSFSSRGRAFPSDTERGYPMDRGFGPSGGSDRGYGERGYSRGFGAGGNDRSFGYSGSERSYGSGGSSGRSFGGGSGDRMNMSDRSYGMGGSNTGGGGEYRNGMNSGAGGGSGGYRNDGGYNSGHGFGSQDNSCKDDSEFYGSGKLFGDNNFQQPMSQGMMGGSNYTSF